MCIRDSYGLDQPLIVQYKNYMAGVLHGDFGVSLKTDRPISDIIGESFPISAKLGLLAALTAIVFGVVLGSIAALMRNRWPDRVIVFFVTLITSMPSFVIATLLLYFFCIKLGVVQACLLYTSRLICRQREVCSFWIKTSSR